MGTNTMSVPLVGTCPNCEGDADEDPSILSHASGHARVCWDPAATLDTINRRTDCSSGRKAVLCVDSHDHLWGNITNWGGISAYSHSASYGHSYHHAITNGGLNQR